MCCVGFMLVGEESILIGIKTPHNKYFIPLVWATSLVARARKEGRIRDDFAVKTIIDVNMFCFYFLCSNQDYSFFITMPCKVPSVPISFK